MNKVSFRELGISFDHYSRTSIPIHHETAQALFRTLHEKGDLIVKEEEQFYSKTTKRFLPDRYVEGDCPHCGYEKARGDQCDGCGKWLGPKELIEPRSKIDGSIPILRKTQHWYLPMGRFAEAWKAWFDGKDWKENVRNYCLGWFQEGLGDRPITRDLHWGVPVPLQEAEGKVLYVWFDAPIGYISATKEWALEQGDPDRWKRYWCDSGTKLVHFIGKDNIVFHAILFPMMLMEAGAYVLPAAIPANEYLTIEGRKISTSQNYAIWLKDYLEAFEVDPLRYTLASNAPETKDTNFSWRQLQSRNNDELADILGNFINRTLTFIQRYYDGIVPRRGDMEPQDREMVAAMETAREQVGDCFENFEVRTAARRFMDVCRTANKYFNDSAPWETRTQAPVRCATTLNVCLQVARGVAVLMAPILPVASDRLKTMLRIEDGWSWDEVGREEIAEGHRLGKPEILFTKIEDDVIEKEVEKLMKTASGTPQPGSPNLIGFDTFQQIDLRIAKVLEAERVEGADRLLRLQVDLGGEHRQIVAGVAESYEPDEMLGKTVIVVTNLKPATIRGIESKGMLLAVNTGNGYALIVPDGEVESGRRVE
jgi:methionyl-tRNA synthetase